MVVDLRRKENLWHGPLTTWAATDTSKFTWIEQTELEDQKWCCVAEGDEQTPLSDEVQIQNMFGKIWSSTSLWQFPYLFCCSLLGVSVSARDANWFERPEASLAKIWRRLSQWGTEGHWTNMDIPSPLLNSTPEEDCIIDITCVISSLLMYY